MLSDNNSSSELVITAYHEAGHTIVARLLGRPILSIILEYKKQAGVWRLEKGILIKEPYSDHDPNWASSGLDQIIPYDEFQFQYPSYPEPYDTFKIVRDFCAIDFAGLVSEEFLYKKMSIVGDPKQSKECRSDMEKARERIEEKFQGKDIENELVYAESYARKILSNSTGWSLVENLAKELIEFVSQGGRPVKEDEFTKVYIFKSDFVYAIFKRIVKPDEN